MVIAQGVCVCLCLYVVHVCYLIYIHKKNETNYRIGLYIGVCKHHA